MDIPEKYIYEVEAAMEQWTDARVIPLRDLQNLILFLLYVPKVMSQLGRRWGGFSCRQKNGQTLLTVYYLRFPYRLYDKVPRLARG